MIRDIALATAPAWRDPAPAPLRVRIPGDGRRPAVAAADARSTPAAGFPR
ncbi:hypothetical protein [Streptomyces sp. NPDC127084]